jgi:periplasmic protein TonB
MSNHQLKQFIMKTKKFPNFPVTIKSLMILPLIIFLFVAILSCSTKRKAVASKTKATPTSSITSNNLNKEVIDEDTPFVVVEEMPVFPGGDSLLLKYIAQNTKYPEVSKTKKIEGRVIVRFCVTKVGGVDRISVLKGVDPEIDSEALRVVGTLPAFKPGRQGGKAVPVWYMVPITFSLK